jgi:pimeloyl-ACP methyl ester carboxylesterase
MWHMLVLATIALNLPMATPGTASGEARPLDTTLRQAASHLVERTDEDPAEPTPLADLLTRFFKTEDERHRLLLVQEIEQHPEASVEKLAELLPTLPLWDACEEAEGTIPRDATARNETKENPTSRGRPALRPTRPADDVEEQLALHYRLPADYDPAQAYPLVLSIPARGMSPRDTLRVTDAALGNTAAKVLRVSLPRSLDPGFAASDQLSALLTEALSVLRREFHLDTSRQVLFGYDEGASAAWMAALMQPDQWSGLIALDGAPALPYPEYVDPWMLENLRPLRVFATWRQFEAQSGPQATAPTDDPQDASAKITTVNANGLHLRAILDWAHQVDLPIRGGETSAGTTMGLAPSPTDRAWILEHQRPDRATTFSTWFRFPGQTPTAFVRVTRFRDPVWEPDQLSLVGSPHADFGSFVRSVIQEKLAYLAGRIEGQVIRIQAAHGAKLELRLGPQDIVFSQPVQIFCNGQRRRETTFEPSVKEMLTTAYAEWEFRRLVVARLSWTVKTDEYPEPRDASPH